MSSELENVANRLREVLDRVAGTRGNVLDILQMIRLDANELRQVVADQPRNLAARRALAELEVCDRKLRKVDALLTDTEIKGKAWITHSLGD